MSTRPWIAIALVAAIGCDQGTGSEPATEPEPAPEPEPETEAEPETGTETEPPPRPDRDSPGGRLAAKVHEASGGGALDRVAELRFRFVVEAGGKRVVDVMHRWDRRNHRDHVTWTDNEGERHDALVDLRTREGCGTVGGEPVTDEKAEKLGDDAYGRWVNDSYWLVMPLKLFDPGVKLSREQPQEHEGETYDVLRLSFDGVGLTPGDTYWLFVDRDDRLVRRWEMQLEGQDEPPKGTSWEGYREVGPLTLAHEHASDDGEHRVLFEDTAALEQIAAEDFEVEGCP